MFDVFLKWYHNLGQFGEWGRRRPRIAAGADGIGFQAFDAF